ncbi:MAG: hypothetical protein HKM07_03890 [Chlamydiae bacterium]|nr:hypothetical protein [Chlamydiota bacterium]
MQKNFWQKCFMSAVVLCLVAQPLIGAEDTPSDKNMMMCQSPMMMSQEMMENDLLKQMDEKDKATYQGLSSEGKALMLKMANNVKMNNNPMMMMQQCMNMMMSKMDMMEKQNMMNMQKK